MKILLFYVSHRQTDEIVYSGILLNKTKFLKENADVYLYCNNKNISIENLEDYLSIYEMNTKLYHTEKNAGYMYGLYEAIDDSFEEFYGYDYVVHLHPDYFIYDENHIVNIIRQMEETESSFGVCFDRNDNTNNTGYHSGLFIFKPTKEIHNYFKLWKDLQKINSKTIEFNNEVVPLVAEFVILYIVRNSGKKYVYWERPAGWNPHDGIWHTHNNNLISRYISENNL